MTIRICIGTEPKTEIARKVLQNSIERNTKAVIEFFPMVGDGWQTNPKLGVGTGFSLKRWTIPERFEYKDWAIYLDADQLVLGDIGELYESDNGEDTSMWCTWQVDKFFPNTPEPNTSVMLINCEAAKEHWWTMEKIYKRLENDVKRKHYIHIMHAKHLKSPPGKIGNEWNHLNKYKEDFTKLIHFTMEHQQPWYSPTNAFTSMWEEELKIALDMEIVTKEEIRIATDKFVKHTKGVRGIGMHPYWKKYA